MLGRFRFPVWMTIAVVLAFASKIAHRPGPLLIGALVLIAVAWIPYVVFLAKAIGERLSH
jgi:hypothetical protein